MPVIPAKAELIFDIELLAVSDTPPAPRARTTPPTPPAGTEQTEDPTPNHRLATPPLPPTSDTNRRTHPPVSPKQQPRAPWLHPRHYCRLHKLYPPSVGRRSSDSTIGAASFSNRHFISKSSYVQPGKTPTPLLPTSGATAKPASPGVRSSAVLIYNSDQALCCPRSHRPRHR